MEERRDMETNGNVIDPDVTPSARQSVGKRRKRDEEGDGNTGGKKTRLPEGFLDFLPLEERKPTTIATREVGEDDKPVGRGCRQFWKAGDYEGNAELQTSTAGMDHVRVHPKFLHANATSHKWALGAIAELLDNAIDEIPNGATFVNIEVIRNPVDASSPMLLFQDDGGGMTGDRMRKCLSFGYSEKTKCANTVGQYGNGFKTSTMRLGADVIVFSKSLPKDGRPATRSIGLLSWTFLTQTGQQDLMVPMLHYEIDSGVRNTLSGNEDEYYRNFKTITKWSPYQSEDAFKAEFRKIKSQGTRIVIFNLWEDDQKRLELDFETDPRDVQVRGRESSNDELAANHPSARHFYLYKYSLRVYASILYLRLPKNFKIVLRGEEVPLHNIVSEDLMYNHELTYKPQAQDSNPGANAVVEVTVGFLKDADKHIDVQGFNVYHRNRLIKPFWRIWQPGSSQGRGVIGVLEANFVQPAHDKQGFERTLYLQRLETRLKQMQKDYWHKNCHKVGYVPWKPKSARKGKKNQKLSEESSQEAEIDMEEEREEEVPVSATPPRRARSQKDDEEPRTDSSKRARRESKVDDEEPRSDYSRRLRARVVEEDSSKKLAITADEAQLPARRFKVTAAKRTVRKANPVPLLALRDAHSPVRADETDGANQVMVNERSSPELDLADIEDRVRVDELAETNEMISSRLEKLEQTEVAKTSHLELEASIQHLQKEKLELEARLQEEMSRTNQLEQELTKMEDELREVTGGLLKERDRYKEELEAEKEKLSKYKSSFEEERKQRDADDELLRKQVKNLLRRQRELEEANKK